VSERYLPPGMKASGQAYESLIDHQMHALTGAEWKALSYAARRTVGFGKETDVIALDQFCEGIQKRDGSQLDCGTGLSRRGLHVALRGLQAKGILKRQRREGQADGYSIDWTAVTGDSQKCTRAESALPTRAESAPVPVQKLHPQYTVQPAAVQQAEKHRDLDYDLDYPASRPKKQDGQPGVVLVPLPESLPKQYPKLREMLARYLSGSASPDPKDYPTDRRVVEVMDAAGPGVSEDEAVNCLCFLYNERGLRPGTKHGPRNSRWFLTVVREHFENKRRQEEAANPSTYTEWADRNDVRGVAMLEAIELPDAPKAVKP